MVTTLTAPARKTQRFEARLDEETAKLLSDAASATGTSLSAFVLDAARDRAVEVMAMADITYVTKEVFVDMMAALNRPAQEIPELVELAAAPRVSRRV